MAEHICEECKVALLNAWDQLTVTLVLCLTVPLVMMRASDLLSASSGSADAATSRKRHEREWEAKGRICSESPAGETVRFKEVLGFL